MPFVPCLAAVRRALAVDRCVAVAVVLVGAYLAAVSCAPEYMLTDARRMRAWEPKPDYEGIRFLVDYWGRDEHLQRGSRVRSWCAPDRDVKGVALARPVLHAGAWAEP